MERRIKNRFYQLTGLIVLILLLSDSVFSQQYKSEKLTECAVNNLLVGIKSDNDGLRRSSIYMAGKYKIEKMVNVLSEMLEAENDANTRILIALSLYQIGSENVLPAVRKASLNDKDVKVKKICTEIYNALIQNNYLSIN